MSTQPEIITRPAFKTTGLSYIGKNQNREVPQLWEQFIPRMMEPRGIDPQTSYGLCIMNSKQAKEGEFEYIAAVEVADDKQIPAGMVCYEVPAYRYAIFTHPGKLDNLMETVQSIYSTGIRQAGVQLHPDNFNMEVYTSDFKPGQDDSKLYIYVAIL